MSANEILTILSPIFVIGGSVYALGRWLWMRFEERMDKGDKAAEERAAVMARQLLVSDTARKDERAEDRGRLNALELAMAELKGQTSTLISIFGGGPHNNLTQIRVNEQGHLEEEHRSGPI